MRKASKEQPELRDYQGHQENMDWQDLKDPQLCNVPRYAMDYSKECVRELKLVETEAKKKLSEDSPKPVSWSTEALTETCKLAVSNQALLAGLLKTAKEHGS